jgi:uncharacterized repeat protein (TIGR03803 family)
VFAIDESSGQDSVLYRFSGVPDGANPLSGVVVNEGILYGTTQNGGTKGFGTIFQIAAGQETVLHSFQGGTDGAYPAAGLVFMNGALYGTTLGQETIPGDPATIFQVSLSGQERVIYQFPVGANREASYASLLAADGVLYGTSGGGGKYHAGTVFSQLP